MNTDRCNKFGKFSFGINKYRFRDTNTFKNGY